MGKTSQYMGNKYIEMRKKEKLKQVRDAKKQMKKIQDHIDRKLEKIRMEKKQVAKRK